MSEAPSTWLCERGTFNSLDGCRCHFGDADPDCEGNVPHTLIGCLPGEQCRNGECFRDVPVNWTCTPGFFNALDGCDCECGVPDPGCGVRK